MSTNPFESCRVILARADEHIAEFSTLAAKFRSKGNRTEHVDTDKNTGQRRFSVRLSEPIPYEANTIALDAITNIRDSLDNAVYASVIASGVVIKSERSIRFPFSNRPQ